MYGFTVTSLLKTPSFPRLLRIKPKLHTLAHKAGCHCDLPCLLPALSLLTRTLLHSVPILLAAVQFSKPAKLAPTLRPLPCMPPKLGSLVFEIFSCLAPFLYRYHHGGPFWKFPSLQS